jgi:hypothetical protein
MTKVKDKIKIYHKSMILELTEKEADRFIVELQSFRQNLKWTIMIDYNTGEQNEIKV